MSQRQAAVEFVEFISERYKKDNYPINESITGQTNMGLESDRTDNYGIRE